MGRRTVLLIVALIVAGLGTALVFMYANRAEEAAFAGQQPVEVLVATADVTAGTSGSAISREGSAELRTLPAAAIPDGALSDLTPVSNDVSLSTIFAGQVILRQMFGTEQQASGGLSLPEGTVAVSVQLGDPERVAGFVQPGSEVAVFTTASGVGGVEEQQTALLLERVPVIAVGPTTVSTTSTSSGGTTNTEEIPTAILTLALTQEEAQKVILATSTAQLYLALLGENSDVDAGTGGSTARNLLN